MTSLIKWATTVLALLGSGLAAAQSSAPGTTVPDTIPGQTQLLHRLSAAMCQHLTAESRRADFDKLEPDAIQKLLRTITYQSLVDNAARFQIVQSLSEDEEKMGFWLTQEATLQLAETCPLARPLLALNGMQTLGQTTRLSVAERTTLGPLAQDICRRLDAENARQSFVSLEPGARGPAVQAAVQAATQESIAAGMTTLTALYGAEAKRTSDQTLQMRLKIGQLAYEYCPVYLNHISRSLLPGPPPANQMVSGEAPPLLLPPFGDVPPPPSPPAKKRRK